jgi:hypothetical protein
LPVAVARAVQRPAEDARPDSERAQGQRQELA